MGNPAIAQLQYGLTTAHELETLGGVGQALLSIDFEELAIPMNGDIDGADFESQGFAFDVANDHSNFANGSIVYTKGPAAVNGGKFFFLHGNYSGGWVLPKVTMSHAAGHQFDLLELSLTEYVLFADATQVKFTGRFPSGATVTKTVLLDGILDGAGGVDDFQTVTFDGSWAGLESVEMLGSGGQAPFVFALDDIRVRDVAPLVTSANFALENLTPDTTYYFRAEAEETSQVLHHFEGSFVTSPTGGNPPEILSHEVFVTDLTATFNWTTDEPARGSVAYGLTDQHELGTLSTALESQTLDFEELGVPMNGEYETGDFTSGGFNFDVSDDEVDFVNGQVTFGGSPGAYNGGTYFYIYGSYNGGWGYPSVTLTPLDGTPFSLHRFDYSETATFVAATKLSVTGQTSAGGILMATFFLDGIIDGVGGAEDFETAVFDETWVDLVSVSVQASEGASGALLALDNFVLNEADGLTTQHSFTLQNLAFGTDYHVELFATSPADAVASTGDLLITTTAFDDHTAPTLSDPVVVAASGNATISWTTDELSETRLEYGLTENYGLSVAASAPVATNLDFEEIVVPMNNDIDAGDFSSGGFTFDISNDHSNFANGQKSTWNFNGSTYFFLHAFYSQGWVYPHTTVTADQGGTFSLKGFDIGELLLGVHAQTVRVTGTKSSGAQIVLDVQLDGILDGTGGADDFQTVVFDQNWNDLVALNLRATAGTSYRAFALDNVQLVHTAGLTRDHVVELTNLGVNLNYNYRVSAVDEAGNETIDQNRTFSTAPAVDDVAPVISNVVVNPATNSVTVTWETDEWTSGKIALGLTPALELGEFDGGGSGMNVIDFETNFDANTMAPIIVPVDDDIDEEDFYCENFLFDISNDHSNFLSGEVLFLNEPVSYNGTSCFYVHGFYNQGWVFPTVDMTSLQAETFDLVQLDVSEATFLANTVQVRFTGTHPNGTTEVLLHDVDMILDGSGPLNDFETLTFGPEWSNLSKLTMQSTGGVKEAEVVYDNIVVREGGGLLHSVTATGLAPGTVYNLQISATDAAGNQTVLGTTTFSTGI